MEETDINKISEVIHHVDELVNGHIDSIRDLLSNNELKNICKAYEENKNQNFDEGFSVFKIVSDLYYREKFHSQIIAALLHPKEKHNEGNKFLCQFLKYLNDKHNTKINSIDYQNAEVTGTRIIGEKKYIDIWIKGSKKCIIIENKIYNAKDQHLQIPTYFDNAEEDKYDIDAIIYLSLDGKKTNTDKSNWEKIDKPKRVRIEKKFVEIAAFNNEDGKEKDLYHGWIIPCTNIANNIDALLILRQYGKLIKSLNKNTMSNQITDKFFNVILNEDNFETALSIRDMLNNLNHFKLVRLRNLFQTKLHHSPFKYVEVQGERCLFTGFTWQNSEMKIQIKNTTEKLYNVQFFDETYYYGEGTDDRALEVLSKIGYNEFKPMTEDGSKKEYYERNFIFPKEENDMITFIDSFNIKLWEFSKKKE